MAISNRYILRTDRLRRYLRGALVIALAGLPGVAAAQDSVGTVNTLERLSLEELLDIEVTLVSKTPQKLSEVPSAIQVLTAEDIRRSGATRLPEALRLA